jgi:DNA-binding YbaB/EbfC family protein
MDLNDMMQQFGPIQSAIDKADEERAQTVLEGSAGGGAVTVRLRGDLQVEGVTIAPAAAQASSDDISMLEDLVLAACNDALGKYRQRFGKTPGEQLQKSLEGSGLGSLLGPLFGGGSQDG